jgi:hypothetical protein
MMASSEEKLDAFLHDLTTYLHERGEKTLMLSKQFEEHAKKMYRTESLM